MSDYRKEMLAVQPIFDMELMLGLLQETRMGGQVMEGLADAWERWLPLLHAMSLEAGGKRYLAIWLDEAVEREVDENWKKSATGGFRLNALAQTMIMGAVYQLVPEVEQAGCAPAPAPTPALSGALEAEGVPYQEKGGSTLCRRFSVLTHMPFRGACDICHLRDHCPKAASHAESFHSVELPGNVRGQEE
ncbi:MAG: hypothetical protein J1E80_01835 [Desulfovibrionaceae bacterium]|nr:hypothetical protein [Desulfovibrionaceae bacterium]